MDVESLARSTIGCRRVRYADHAAGRDRYRWRQLPGGFDLPLPTVVHSDADDPWPTITAQVREWTGSAHDLRAVPGVHQWIISAPGRTFWVLAVHHALIDAYGLSLVFNRGAALYGHLVAGTRDTAILCIPSPRWSTATSTTCPPTPMPPMPHSGPTGSTAPQTGTSGAGRRRTYAADQVATDARQLDRRGSPRASPDIWPEYAVTPR